MNKFEIQSKFFVSKLRKSMWNLFLLSETEILNKHLLFEKRTREIGKIEFRWARQETDHTKLISLRTIQIPYIFVKKYYYQKKNIFRVKKGLIRTILSFFFEVTSEKKSSNVPNLAIIDTESFYSFVNNIFCQICKES